MSIVQKNLYTVGQNLNNQAENIDLNRVADDKTFISVNFGTSPATVTIKVGSTIEVNGNLYAIEGSDESFQMSSTSHLYITFDGTTFASAAGTGTFDPAKGGYYTGTSRTLRWYIDHALSLYGVDLTITNTTNNLQSLDVLGGLSVGGGGFNILEIKLITGTTANATGTNVSYPTGFTQNNCMVLGMDIDRGSQLDGQGTLLANQTIYITLSTSVMFLVHIDPSYFNQAYRILLARF